MGRAQPFRYYGFWLPRSSCRLPLVLQAALSTGVQPQPTTHRHKIYRFVGYDRDTPTLNSRSCRWHRSTPTLST